MIEHPHHYRGHTRPRGAPRSLHQRRRRPRSDSDGTATATASDEAVSGAADGDDATAAHAQSANELATSYIAAGGSGVAVRNACEDGARSGTALPDSTQVTVAQIGTRACDGWSLVLSGGGS